MQYVVDWTNPTHCRLGEQSPEFAAWPGVEIRTMPDGDLWGTINWLVQHMRALHAAAGAPKMGVVQNVRMSHPRSPDPTQPVDSAHPWLMVAPPPNDLDARLWLRDQPVFVALVLQAVERNLTFEDATSDYLRRYVIRPHRQVGTAFTGTPPWRDPQRLREQARLRQAVKKELTGDDGLHARRLRDIDI